MEFSGPQRALLNHGRSDKILCIAVGAVRSGKSFATTLAFLTWLSALRESWHHAILSQSLETGFRNHGLDVLELAPRLGMKAEVDRRYGTRIVLTGPGMPEQSIWMFGASDARGVRRLQGATLAGLVIDEATLLSEDTFTMAWSRLSTPVSRAWATCNPDAPAHFVKRDVIDRADAFRAYTVHFLMHDNPSLSAEVIQRYSDSLTGWKRQRLFEGLWTAASGLIYPDVFTVSKDPEDLPFATIGLDYATSGTVAGIMFRHDRACTQAVASHELRHVGADDGLLSEPQLALRLNAFATSALGHRPDRVAMLIDPSAPNSLHAYLRQQGFVPRNARNDVLPGIAATDNALRSGALRVHERCQHLRGELAAYSWNPRFSKFGEDRPLKTADFHAVDALRYFAFTIGLDKPRRTGMTDTYVAEMPAPWYASGSVG